MEKQLLLSLRNFPITPHSLRTDPSIDKPAEDVSVNLAQLYHHYYMDGFGHRPPTPDPAQFEHIRHFCEEEHLRARGDGLGDNPAFRQHRSNELGQAFCRWFLYEHVGLTYFAHMSKVLNKAPHRNFDGITLTKTEKGDGPDYLCAENTNTVYFAEAKGRTSAISFGSKEFKEWRRQFDRVTVTDRKGIRRSVKGYVVATRFATEANPRVKSHLFAEDPSTDGEPWHEGGRELRRATICVHYSRIARKIRQPILAASLEGLFAVPPEIRFPVVIWRCLVGPLADTKFVGGYFPSSDGASALRLEDGQWVFVTDKPLRLDIAPGTFFGVELSAFKQMVATARSGPEAADEIRSLPEIQPFYSGLSFLRDGSVIGPVEMFQPISQEAF